MGLCASESTLANRCGKFLLQRNRIPRQAAYFKGLAAQSVCPGLYLIVAEKGGGQKFPPRRSRIQRQMASFKGLAAKKCPGLCPVAWGQSKWLLSRGWLLRARVLASVLWHGAQ